MAENKSIPRPNAFSKIIRSRLFRIVLSLLFLSLAAVFAQVQADRSRPKMFAPHPEQEQNPLLVRSDGSGLRQLAADLSWIQTLLALKGEITPEDGRPLQQTLRLVAAFDPWFSPAYLYGGLNLSIRAGSPALANLLLEEGGRALPRDWQIPFLIGWNCYRELQDLPGALRWMRESAACPEAPAWLAELRPELLRLAENPARLSAEFPALAERAGTEWGRTCWGSLSVRITIQRDLKELNRLVKNFEQKFGKAPGNLEELVWNGFLEKVPAHPLGGNYFFDAPKKKVFSSVN